MIQVKIHKDKIAVEILGVGKLVYDINLSNERDIASLWDMAQAIRLYIVF